MLKIESLRAQDIPAGRRLSDAVNWNHLDVDWNRLITLWPDTCLAGWLDGDVIATATLARFPGAAGSPDLAWVGVMLVDAAHRGAGHGGQMFDAILQRGADVGVTNFGLDATDMGRPLYAKRGFLDHSRMHRWKRPAPPQDSAAHSVTTRLAPGVRPMIPADWDQVLDLDREASALDRAVLLRKLANEDGALTLVAESPSHHEVTAFGIRRLGRVADYIGPLIAQDPPAADALLDSLLTARSTPLPMFIDTADSPAFEPRLKHHGFEIARTLTRMARAAPHHPIALTPKVFAIAGLELC